jgi:spore maturation protein CgeB
LRLFLAIPHSPNPSFTSDLWKANLHDPLVAMGHDVVLWDGGSLRMFDLDPDDPATGAERGDYSHRFLAEVESAHRARPLDLVITYFSDSHVEPGAIGAVRERVAPILNFFCNNVHQFHLARRNARHYSLCLVPEADVLERYREAGAEPYFFPMAAHPERYRPLETAFRYDATFAGQRYGDRTGGILALREAGIDAHAFGQHWSPPAVDDDSAALPAARAAAGPSVWRILRRALSLAGEGKSPLRAARDRREWERLSRAHPAALHGPVDDNAYVALFSESRISLGFLVLGDTHRSRRPLRQIRLREFEAPMAGAFYVTGWIEEIALHYEVGTEIVCYRSQEELVDRCRYYLRHEDERDRIRRAGHARARRDHTWTRRFEDLFGELRRRGLVRAAR